MFKIEKKFIKYIEENSLILGIAGVSTFAILMRIFMFKFESRDYLIFLSQWFDYLKDNGGFRALGSYEGNYNAPYMTIMAILTYIPIYKLYSIKILSVIFDFALAISSGLLVRYVVKNNKNLYFFITYSVILIFPEVVFNSSIWGQCDSGYATFVVLALLFLLKEKYLPSFIMLGIAFAFKLQFIFILPVFIIVYFVKKKFSILNFLIIPAVNFVLCLPAIIMGKPISELLLIYVQQIDEFKNAMSLNFLNIYGLVLGNYYELQAFGIFATFAICLITLIVIIYKKVKLNDEKILNLSLWFFVMTTFLLPRMHERYLYVGAILAIIYFIIYKKNFMVLISITLCSIITYFNYLFNTGITNKELFIIGYTIVICLYTKNLFKMLCEDRK